MRAARQRCPRPLRWQRLVVMKSPEVTEIVRERPLDILVEARQPEVHAAGSY